jgi:dTDP-4-amino-4,6-dideoxygalactose transaminase
VTKRLSSSFAVQSWLPWQQSDKDMLENMQRRAIRMVSGLRGSTYKDQLKELALTTLEERRHQADMAHMYKICMEKDSLKRSDWFEPLPEAAARTRQHADPLNMRLLFGRLDTRHNFFTVRMRALERYTRPHQASAHSSHLQTRICSLQGQDYLIHRIGNHPVVI